jgi:hypothetical protein
MSGGKTTTIPTSIIYQVSGRKAKKKVSRGHLYIISGKFLFSLDLEFNFNLYLPV